MKKVHIIILSISFLVFLLIQTAYYWEFYSGNWNMPVTIFLVVLFLVLCVSCMYQFGALVKNMFRNKVDIISVSLIAVLLGLTAYAPNGLINFEDLEGEDLLVAEAEGAANCTTVLKLRSNGTFKERSVCFGVSVIEGTYTMKGDTIIFSDLKLGRGEDEYYTHAVISPVNYNNKKIIGELLRYNGSDKIPRALYIIKNEFKK